MIEKLSVWFYVGMGIDWVELGFAKPEPDLSKNLRPKPGMWPVIGLLLGLSLA